MSSSITPKEYVRNGLYALFVAGVVYGIAWFYNTLKGNWDGWASVWGLFSGSLVFFALNGPLLEETGQATGVVINKLRGGTKPGVPQINHARVYAQQRVGQNAQAQASQPVNTQAGTNAYTQQATSQSLPSLHEALDIMRARKGSGEQLVDEYEEMISLLGYVQKEVKGVTEPQLHDQLTDNIDKEKNIMYSTALESDICNFRYAPALKTIRDVAGRLKNIKQIIDFSKASASQNQGSQSEEDKKKDKLEQAYKTLEVDSSATDEEVKKIYNAKVRKLHPDVNSDPKAGEDAGKVIAAYKVIKDARKEAKQAKP